MFKLEKIFQVSDSVYINISIVWKSISVFLSIYIFSILKFNSIFDLLNYDIYITSKYFYLSSYFTISYLIFSSVIGTMKRRYKISYLIFLINDIVPLVVSLPFTLYLFFILKLDFNIDINILYLFILIICNIFIFRKISDFFYNYLIDNNTIQRNIMLVGTVENKWNHPHMSFSGLMLSMLMRFIQGKDDIYYCGSYATPANGHDLSLCSGICIAMAMGANYPFPENKDAYNDFLRLRRIMGI